MSADKQITLFLDVNRRVEPLVSIDANGSWQRTKLEPLIQGSILDVLVKFVQFDSNGVITELVPEATDSLSIVGKRRNLNGDILYSSTDMAVTDYEWEGTLSLHTLDLDEAISTYPSLATTMEIQLKNSDDSLINYWQIGATIVRKAYGGTPPVVPGGPEYYTSDECDSMFIRKDAPTGYGVKLVELDGKKYIAQLVGTKWVVNKIIKVGEYYTNTFVEVEVE